MPPALPPSNDRVLHALASYRKALGSGPKPDPRKFLHDLSHAEQLDFLSSVGEPADASRDGVTADLNLSDMRDNVTLDSAPVVAVTTDVGVDANTTLDSAPEKPQSLERTKLPGQYETAGLGDFALSDGSVIVPPASASSDRLADYELLNELGRGGMGVVYKARQKALNRIVALKMVLAGGRASKQQLARFMAEARAVARLDHPNIVQVYDIGTHDDLPFFAMEYVEGGALDSLVKKQSMDALAAARMMESVCRAMHYAHTKGVIHRDIKPANVLLMSDTTRSSVMTKTGDKTSTGTGHHPALKSASGTSPHTALKSHSHGPVPKITDFGLAKTFDDEHGVDTKSGAVMGTPNYMAPEQAEGNTKEVTHLADVYSLGATLYELITGRPPFQGPSIVSVLSLVRSADPVNPSRLQPGIPKDLETICLKAMQKEPAKRYESAELMADDLARFLDGQPILARPIGTIEKAVRWAKRKPREASLWATAAALAIGIFGVFVWSDLRVRTKNVEIAKAKDVIEEKNTALTSANVEIGHERDVATRQSELNAEQVRFLLRTLSAELKVLGLTKSREKLVAQALTYIGKMERLTGESQGIADRGRISAAIQIGEFYEELGKAERDMDSFKKAQDQYDRAVSLARKQTDASPDSDLARGNLALAYSCLAQLKLALGHIEGSDGAAALADKSYTLRKEIVESPKSPEGTRDYLFPADRLNSLAESHDTRGRIATVEKNRDLARVEQKKALELYEKAYAMALADPKASEEPLKLAAFQSKVAHAYLVEAAELSAEAGLEKDGKKAAAMRTQAESFLTKALTAFEKAVEENAESLPFKKELSGILFRFGVNRLIARKYAEARDAFDRCYTIRDRIVKEGDEGASKQNVWDVSVALYGVGFTQSKLGERARAASSFKECLRLRDKLLAEDDNLVFARGVALASARIGDHAKAMAVLAREEEREPKRATPLYLFDAAATASIAAEAVGNAAPDDKLAAAQKTLREKYLAASWDYVKRLSVANPTKAREVASDPDFEYLQGRPGFKETLDGILAKK
jgi:serine/threonine protein kinase